MLIAQQSQQYSMFGFQDFSFFAFVVVWLG